MNLGFDDHGRDETNTIWSDLSKRMHRRFSLANKQGHHLC